MDVFDRAQQIEALHRNNALAAHANRVRPRCPVEVTECEECGDEIPEGRRKAEPGCILCVECKSREEKRGKNPR